MPIFKPFSKLKGFIITEKAFLKNVSFVLGGRVYVALLSLVFTPILARLFTPEAYGEYGLFSVIIQNLVVMGTLSLPIAISTAKKEQLNNVLSLTFISIISFSGVFAIAFVFFQRHLDALFTTSIFSQYWIFMLVGFVLAALLASLQAINIRLQKFKTNTQVGIIEGSSVKLFNLGGGIMGLASAGLIFSDMLSKLLSLLLLIKKIPEEIHLSLPNRAKAKALLAEFKSFPLFVMPSQWIGTLNNQLMLILVAYLFTKNDLGQLVMAIGLVGIPLNVLTNSFQPVITERLSTLSSTTELQAFFKKSALLLFALAVIIFGIILLLPPSFFTLLLGDKWIGIKPIINTLAFLYAFLLIDRSFENGFIVLGKQKAVLYFSLVEWLLQITGLIIAYILNISFLEMITAIVVIRSIVALTRLVYLRRNLKLVL